MGPYENLHSSGIGIPDWIPSSSLHRELPIWLNVEFVALYNSGCRSSTSEMGCLFLFPTPLTCKILGHGGAHSALLAADLSSTVHSLSAISSQFGLYPPLGPCLVLPARSDLQHSRSGYPKFERIYVSTPRVFIALLVSIFFRSMLIIIFFQKLHERIQSELLRNIAGSTRHTVRACLPFCK